MYCTSKLFYALLNVIKSLLFLVHPLTALYKFRVEVQSVLPLLQSSNLTQRLGVLPSEVVQVREEMHLNNT